MFSFRQKIFVAYVLVFLVFVIGIYPFSNQAVKKLVIKAMRDRATEIIEKIKEAPNNDALIRRLKEQKSLIFFRVSVITDEHKVLYDSHTKRVLGPRFSQEYVVEHPEVLEAFKNGIGYYEDYSELLGQKFSYIAKSFDFHGKTYVMRTAFPYQYITAITNDFEIGVLVLSSVVLLLFSMMTWFIINYLTNPIQQIIKAVKPYQEGMQNTIPKINIKSSGDFEKLANTLNTLTLRIQKQIDSITLERNEKEAILESLVEGVIAVSPEMIVTYINNVALKLFNIDDKLLIDQPFEIQGLEKCYELLISCQKEDKPLLDTLNMKKDGKKLFLDIVAAPKKENSGAILVLQDKTSHYKLLEMRKDFIANASHELKTPITIIRGFAETLHDHPDLPPETCIEVTAKIVRNCKRMTNVIKDLLILTDVESIPLSRLSQCDLFEMISNCCSTILDIYPNAIININKPEDNDIQLIADPHLMALAFMNLIENAAKYSNPPPQITIDLEELENKIKIKIADKGIGIPTHDLEHIFERFYTVDKAHSQKMGGSGLGLSIVETIILKHQGRISVDSEIGKGTTFTILLPIRKEELY